LRNDDVAIEVGDDVLNAFVFVLGKKAMCTPGPGG
jgi:hypothetical protein